MSRLSDYLCAKAAFETRAEKLFRLSWPALASSGPWYLNYNSVFPNEDGTVSFYAAPTPENDEYDYELVCAPILFECDDEDLVATFAQYPPRQRVYTY